MRQLLKNRRIAKDQPHHRPAPGTNTSRSSPKPTVKVQMIAEEPGTKQPLFPENSSKIVSTTTTKPEPLQSLTYDPVFLEQGINKMLTLDSESQYQPSPATRSSRKRSHNSNFRKKLDQAEEQFLLRILQGIIKRNQKVPPLIELAEFVTKKTGYFSKNWERSFIRRHKLNPDLFKDRAATNTMAEESINENSNIQNFNGLNNPSDPLREDFEIFGQKKYDPLEEPIRCDSVLIDDEARPINMSAEESPRIIVIKEQFLEEEASERACQRICKEEYMDVESVFLSEEGDSLPPRKLIYSEQLNQVSRENLQSVMKQEVKPIEEESPRSLELDKLSMDSEILQSAITRRPDSKYRMLCKEEKETLVKMSYKTSITHVAKKYGISINNICRWRKCCERRSGAGRKVSNPMMEKELIAWVREQFNRDGRSPSRADIQRKARSLVKDPTFKASKGWYQRFISRNKFLRKRGSAENYGNLLVKVEADYEY